MTSEVPNGEIVLMLVASGVGLMFSAENAGRMLAVTDLQWKPGTDLGIEVCEIVMWRPDDADTPLLRPFLDIVRELRAEFHAPSTGRPQVRANDASGPNDMCSVPIWR